MYPRRRGVAYHHSVPKGQLSQGHYPTTPSDGQRRKVNNPEAFQSFDIWKNLDKIRSSRKGTVPVSYTHLDVYKRQLL